MKKMYIIIGIVILILGVGLFSYEYQKSKFPVGVPPINPDLANSNIPKYNYPFEIRVGQYKITGQSTSESTYFGIITINTDHDLTFTEESDKYNDILKKSSG